MRKYIRGVEVYHFKDDDTFDMYLSVMVYRADARGWARPRSYRLHGGRMRRYWQMTDAMRRAW